MRRQPRFAIAIIALVGFGLMELALNSERAGAEQHPRRYAADPVGHQIRSRPARSVGSTHHADVDAAWPCRQPRRSAAAPGAPAALSTTSALPSLAPAPAVVAGGTVPTPQSIFTCSCFGVGLGTRWVGQVQSTNFQNAASAAAAQCTAYAINSGTLSRRTSRRRAASAWDAIHIRP